ncbi:host-nuclease inhibitor Gam family protein [Blastomonas fulva]|uniref:host-nuclease inhibitor Gam family protein n=1 Tax=Blastomonas fulva TaxID=1550728 RepID=UPI0025A412D2|nr:host-nuclease inhibitor Gam family protein [Blastomonas fulva]MDM7928649.1 host-nuclease inhibitor Gam family protein [Blastomonas fulva]MDM7964435.1 host-nuclease inhibitor Gam family protein [Blastomonas fulva]
MAKRRKATAVDAPQTMAEAIALADRYVALEQAAARAQAFLDKQIADAKSTHAITMETIEPQLQTAFAGLRAWYAANAAGLTKGKRRSIPLGPIVLGERTGMPKLKLPKGMKAKAALDWLKGMGRWNWAKYIRTKEELDKQAIIKALSASEDADPVLRHAQVQFMGGGFTVTQAEEFFIRTGEEETPIDMESQNRPTF